VTDFTRFTRGDWLGLADRFYARLDRTFASLSAADWERGTPYLGWRARDVLAHMTPAMPVNFRQVLDRALAGNPAAPAEFDTFTRNAREVARRRRVPTPDIVREWPLARARRRIRRPARRLVSAGVQTGHVPPRAGAWLAGRRRVPALRTRAADWIQGPARAEDVVARITGMATMAWAVGRHRVRVRGDRATAVRLNRAFWHFWERTAMNGGEYREGLSERRMPL
jgi:hypothetical protein